MRRVIVPVLLAAVAGYSGVAAAQPHRPPGPVHASLVRPGAAATAVREHPLTFQQAVEHLHSTNPDDVDLGVDALTQIGTAAVIPPLIELIHSGLPDALLNSVVEKLGYIGRPEAIDVLAEMLQHRRPIVRRNALHALRQIHDDRVRPLLESGLRDSDSTVRGEAAHALGATNARASIDILVRAFERNVPEAAEAIGQIGDAAAADHLLDAVGHSPLTVLLPGFLAFLNRRDLQDPVKVHIIEQVVARSPTRQVKTFLQDWVSHLPPADRSRARTRAELAIRQISDTPATGTPSTTGTIPAGATAAGGSR